MTKHSKWNGFTKEISNLIFFWFFAIIFFTIYRSIFIFWYRKEMMESTGLLELWKTYTMAFRFDCTVVSYFLIVPLVATLVLSAFGKFGIIKKIRIIFQYLFVILSTFVCIITINYYKEFGSQFNNFLFLGIHDDQVAIAKTIIEYYNPVTNLILLFIVIVVSILIFRLFENKTAIDSVLKKIKPTKYNKVIFVAITIGLFVFCARGTFGKTPTTRMWAARSTDLFLNKTIINPLRSLKYAYSDYKKVSSITGENPYGEINLTEFHDVEKVSDIIAKKAQGNKIEKPKQVFMIIMESYDYWPLMDKYVPFSVSSNINRIANNGTTFQNFLPAYHATFYAYGSIVSGIPCFGININTLSRPSEPYISSIFSQFKKLGYTTNMFYGGYSSWENIGSFTESQACDNIYTAANTDTEIGPGGWGIDDEKLFELVLNKVDSSEYTFNLILTTSNHAPFSVDMYDKGFPYKSEKDIPKDMQKYFHDGISLLELGHFWYGDWAVGQFMDEAEKKYKTALYGFTGDHFSRRFINSKPNLYESSAVPFVLYGNGIPQQKLDTPGGHADITPTFIELIAPKDFEYYSFGTSMLDSTKHIGVGCEKVIDRHNLYYSPKDADTRVINTTSFEEAATNTLEYQKEYDDLMRLSWHYIVRGDSLKLKPKDVK